MSGEPLYFENVANKKWVPVGFQTPLPVRLTGGGQVSQFGEVSTVKRTPIIELNSSYGPSLLRDSTTVTGSGDISKAASGEILLSTGATSSSTTDLESAAVGRYIPGYGAEVGIGVRIPTAPTGNIEARFGGRTVDKNNGFYFLNNASGLNVVYESGGVETTVAQTDWNIDKVDGSGPSGFTLDLTAGNIFQIEYTWYGYGQVLFGVVATFNNSQRFIPCHSLRVTGSTSIQSPNLRVFTETLNGADSVDFDIYVGGRQYSIVGDYIPKVRFTGQSFSGVATSTTATTNPLVSFRTKTAFRDRGLIVGGYTIKPVTEDCIVEVYLNATLTGASWATPTNATAAETAVEADISATSFSGGTLIHSEFHASGQANQGLTSGITLDIDIPEQQPITLAVRTLSGTGTASGILRIREEW